MKATGREAAGAGGWVETAQGGWIARARVDRVPAPLDGDLPVGREGMVTGRVLPDEWVPSDLVPIPDSLKTAGYEGRTMRLRRGARDAFARMMAAAAADGITLRIFSAWRSAEFQRRLYERAVDRDPAQVSTAAPGRSEHRLGTTVDVSTPGARHLHPELAETPAGRWIARRATEFGIVVSFSRERHAARGMSREPWHLRWVDSAVTDDTAW